MVLVVYIVVVGERLMRQTVGSLVVRVRKREIYASVLYMVGFLFALVNGPREQGRHFAANGFNCGVNFEAVVANYGYMIDPFA